MNGTAVRRTMTPGAGMIGRDAELARLEGALAAACAGRSTVVAVVGAYGLGKTALLDTVRADAVGQGIGARVLATQGRAADAELGFASLLTLLRPVESELDELAGDLAPQLRAALALDRRQADAVAVRVATLRVLSALAAEQPLVLLIDDAHLLDRASADVLAFVAGRFYADAVLTVLATEQYAPTAFGDLGPDTVALGGLDAAGIVEILDRSVPLAPGPRHRCVELADGNPLAALELAASLDAGQRSGEAPMPLIPRLSGVIGSAFAQRLDRLGEQARNALAMVAADDTGELAVVVDALARLGEPDGGLAQAEAAGLVTTDSGTVRFTHPLIRPVAYHQIGAASRRVAHGALAAVLDAPHQGASRAWQMVAAAERPDATVSGALALVAEDIARRGGPASAARTLECAAALAPGLDQRRDHLVAATASWLDAGEALSAARVADVLASLPATGESVAVAAAGFQGMRPAAQVLAFVGGAVSAVDGVDRVATAAVLADEMLAAGAVGDAVALARSLAGAPYPAGGLADAVLAAAGAGTPPPSDDECASGAYERDPENPPDERAGAVADRARILGTAAAVDAGMPLPAAAVGRPLVAVGGTGLDLAVSRARAALHAGEVADAHDQLLRLDAVVPDDPAVGRARLDLALAETELLVGRAGDARRRAGTVASWAAELGLGWLRSRAEGVLGRVALAGGDDEAAVVHLRAACRVVPHLAAADLVAAAAMADRPTEAERARLLVRRLIGDAGPILDIRARRATGALGSQSELDIALRRSETARLPLEAATVVLIRAELAWRSGDLDAAAEAAREAQSRWVACGVSGWAPRLARLERRSEPVAPPEVASLSPAEHRVAMAVAEGRTNQEAAEALYLSVKTIDFHLQNIYRKLGLRSRTELAVVVHHGTVSEQVAS
jgi:DNA-binding CsgD family transcriptional regulator